MSKLQKCLYIIDLLERRGAMSLREINEHYSYSSLYDGEPLQARTFARYKEFILDNFPCYIEYNQHSNEYYLVKDPELYGKDDSLFNYLLSAYHIEGISELALKHRRKLQLSAAPTGVENVQIILEAIDKKKGLEFDYWAYNKRTKKRLVAIPYFLKTWEQRWYMVAEPDNHHHGQSVFALERMDDIRLTEEEMLPSSDITADEYFYGSFGVNHSDNQKPLTIQIRVFGTQVDYVRALPIHESQREIDTTDDWSVFEYQIVPCFNFYQQLLWHREKIEVLSPASVREEMENILISTLNHYKKP